MIQVDKTLNSNSLGSRVEGTSDLSIIYWLKCSTATARFICQLEPRSLALRLFLGTWRARDLFLFPPALHFSCWFDQAAVWFPPFFFLGVVCELEKRLIECTLVSLLYLKVSMYIVSLQLGHAALRCSAPLANAWRKSDLMHQLESWMSQIWDHLPPAPWIPSLIHHLSSERVSSLWGTRDSLI